MPGELRCVRFRYDWQPAEGSREAGMKTLRNNADKDEILRRLEQLQPDSQRRWGRMTTQQMVCHLSDGLRMYMKERDVAIIPASEIERKVLKWGALWAPIP